ncbi:MAG: MBL fold metallo-hydrolase [Magnetovibrio sp.]|nr:MBL fold metallo-hydrolase [Magnetovibrio sp.]
MRKTFIAAAVALAVSAGAAQAQGRDFSKVEITATKLADGVHMLTGAGGNIGVSSGDDGVFLVDDQFAPLTVKILAAIRKITPKPVKFVVNTHWHFDHTGGNENLGKAGTVIVAHDNVRELMRVDQVISAFGRKIPAAPKAALPVITFNDTTTFHMNGQTLRVRHMPAAHTSGDSIVHFVEADVVHMGDLFFNGFYPFIDVEHGGSAAGMIKAADAVLAMAGPNTKIIPGHGPLADKVALRAYRDMLKGVHDAVKKLVDAGTPRAEAVAAQPTQAFDAEWGDGFLRPEVFAGFVYDSMTK